MEGWRERSPSLPFPTVTSSSVRLTELEWLPLSESPIFRKHRRTSSANPLLLKNTATMTSQSNLVAWDATSSRLYLWDSDDSCLHRLSVRFGDLDDDGNPSILAASPSEVLLTNIYINSPVHHISLNGEGSAVIIACYDEIFVIYVFDRVSSDDDSIICRTVSVGSDIYYAQNNHLRIIQVCWHPYSRTHVGILSSDSVFRLYDLSSDLKKPEQEYYLQPIEPGRYSSASSICPVAFSFGGEHLWDRFSVFILFNDGSIYILCPVVPFGRLPCYLRYITADLGNAMVFLASFLHVYLTVFSWPCLDEIYEDVNTFGLKSSNAKTVSNSWFAVTWLESTFPELANQSGRDNVAGLRARPYAPMDASLTLQGPLHKVFHAMLNENSDSSVDLKGKAVSFLYNSIGKDSVMVIAWSNGQLQIDALADEVQPLWSSGTSPHLRVDSHGRIVGMAMICESISQESFVGNLDPTLHQGMSDTIWLGNPPPLLGLAIVDLALPKNSVNNLSVSLYPDPVVPERIFCFHHRGVDLIILHFLPFSNSNTETDESSKIPSVYPILGGCDDESSSESLLCGFVALADSFGNPRAIGITPFYECITLDVKRWNELPLFPVEMISGSDLSSYTDVDIPELIKKDLITGPKLVIVPESTTLRNLSAESINGRSALHQYIKFFHEHYVEYAHKVYIELKQHGHHLKTILDEQHTCLRDANEMLSSFEARQSSLRDRANKAVQRFSLLEQRLQNFRNLPSTKKKPLSKAEREFKAQLERLAGVELDALHSSVEALSARTKRFLQSSPSSSFANSRQSQGKKNKVRDDHLAQLRSAMEKLSLLNNENTKKVKAIESALKNQEKEN